MRLSIENIRVFSGQHFIPIRPLTILIGENSSGKSTILAALDALCDRGTFPLRPNFNRPPYSLGNFDTIATYKGGRYGRAKHFSLGFESEASDPQPHRTVNATYGTRDGQIELQALCTRSPKFDLDLDVRRDAAPPSRDSNGHYRVRVDDAIFEGDLLHPLSRADTSSLPLLPLIEALLRSQQASSKDGPASIPVAMVGGLITHLGNLSPAEALSVAPIRTKPERTYGQVPETFQPAGDHIPFVLEQMLGKRRSTSDHRMIEALRIFGKESGLFRDIDIKHLGNKVSDPFQLLVRIAGPLKNLIDVGYGVSQSLPIVVQARKSTEFRYVLVQQPEVHLHPRAQAALGTYFARVAAESSSHLIIETHSDYILDRIRQEVARETISPDAIIIVYCHREQLETEPHLLRLDRNGNLLDVPAHYRQFFLQEELNLFNRRDGA